MGPSRAKYRRALAAARRELTALEDAREHLDARLSQLRQTIGALSALCEEHTEPRGFTDAVRDVLRASVEALTPAQVRDRLQASGFALDGYSNPLASIHVILKRLVAAGEARSYEGPPGTRQYWWNRPVRAIALTREQLPQVLARLGYDDTHFSAKEKKS
jgi:hypothetical protein